MDSAAVAIVLVVTLGIAAQWVAWRLRWPAIVVLSAVGLAVGRSGLEWIVPVRDFGELLHPLVGFAVAVILFDGGLQLKLHELGAAAKGVRRLVTLAPALGWVFGTAAAYFVGGLSFPVALLLGALLIVTGPTVVMPLLRQARLKRRPASFLKWEGIVNDPTGALLAVLVFEFFTHASASQSAGLSTAAVDLGIAGLAGAALGAGAGFGLGRAFRSGAVPEFLKAPTLLATVIAVYALGNLAQDEAGLLATTILGVVVGNLALPSLGELQRFKESVAILLVSSVFIVLTAGLDPASLGALDGRALLFLGAMLFVVRPAAILLSTIGTDMSRGERLLVSWIAPRGVVAAAVAGFFAPRLVEAGYADGGKIVPLVFGLIFLTVVLHGFTLRPLARKLGLSAGDRDGVLIVGASAWSTGLARLLVDLEVPVLIVDSSWDHLRDPRLAGVPVRYGEVLSADAEDWLGEHRVDIVLSATDDDSYNALVCARFGPELGRDKVFQLAHHDYEAHDPRVVAESMRGRVIMDENAYFDSLVYRQFEHWTFRRTRLTEEFGVEDLERETGEGSLTVLACSEAGKVTFFAPSFRFEPSPGDTIVRYAEPESAVTAVADEAPVAAG